MYEWTSSHIILFVAFYFRFALTRFVILVERWSGHDARWGISQSTMEIEPEKFRPRYEVHKFFLGRRWG